MSPATISRADSVASLEFRTAGIGVGSSRGSTIFHPKYSCSPLSQSILILKVVLYCRAVSVDDRFGGHDTAGSGFPGDYPLVFSR